jgi:sugar phosphate isomerase/epimerase
VKLSVSTLTCPDWPLERIIATAREYGLAGIEFRGLQKEIDITRLIAFTVHLDQTLAGLRAANLAMPCLKTSVTLLAPPGQRWEAMMEECHRYAELAAAAGTPFIRIFGGQTPSGLEPSEALSLARRRLRQIVKLCHSRKCRPLIETHDDWATAPKMMELLEGMNPAEAAVLWDIEHPFRAGETPAETVEGLGEFLAHVHFKDSRRIGEHIVPTLMGDGNLPIRDCQRALNRSGYAGWICLETEKRWYADAPEPEQSIPHFASYMQHAPCK